MIYIFVWIIESRCYIYRLKGHHRLGVAWVVSTLPHPSFKTQNLSSHSLKICFFHESGYKETQILSHEKSLVSLQQMTSYYYYSIFACHLHSPIFIWRNNRKIWFSMDVCGLHDWQPHGILIVNLLVSNFIMSILPKPQCISFFR